jgi:hypothetical protein
MVDVVTSIPDVTEVKVEDSPTFIIDTTEQTIVVTEVSSETIVTSIEDTIVVSEEDVTTILSSATQGPPGPQGSIGPAGPPGAGISVQVGLPTRSPISGQRVLTVDNDGYAIHADRTIIDHMTKIVGVSTHAVTDNGFVQITSSGYLEESTWNWAPNDPVFLGLNGELTQAIPTSGFMIIIATVLSPTKLLINMKEPIIISPGA